MHATSEATAGARGVRRPRAGTLARAGFLALCVATAAGYVVYPAHPSYDALYSLIWGSEIAAMEAPSLGVYRASTEHPLAIAFGVLASPLGQHADRALVVVTLGAYVALVAGVFRLARLTIDALAGWIAAGLVLSRLDYAFFAVRGYVDVPYLALIVWAAVLEYQRPRRGGIVWGLLLAAGLLRPEAWLLLAVYGVWMAWPASWPRRIRYAALAAAAPLAWAAFDAVFTGDPFFSFRYTRASADELRHSLPLAEIPQTTLKLLIQLTKPPIFAAALAGGALALWLRHRRLVMPAVLLGAGVATFLITSVAGFSALSRYMAISGLAILVFASFAVTAYRFMPSESGLRRPAAGLSAVLALAGAGFTLATLSPAEVDRLMDTRVEARANLAAVLATPSVRSALRCGPVSVPNHKLIPDVRRILGFDERGVLARSDRRQRRATRRGVAIFVLGDMLDDATYGPFQQRRDSPLIQVPGRGFARVAGNEHFAAYARC